MTLCKETSWSLLFTSFSNSLKHEKIVESIYESFQAHKKWHCVKKPHGVIFKLFLGSLNMKRLSSDFVFLTLVKAFEESSLQWQVISFLVRIDYLWKRNTLANHAWKSYLRHYFILFWALGTKSYEKGSLWSLLPWSFRLSKHEWCQVFFHWTH